MNWRVIWDWAKDWLADIAEAASFFVHWIIRLILAYLLIRAAYYVFLICLWTWYKLFSA